MLFKGKRIGPSSYFSKWHTGWHTRILCLAKVSFSYQVRKQSVQMWGVSVWVLAEQGCAGFPYLRELWQSSQFWTGQQDRVPDRAGACNRGGAAHLLELKGKREEGARPGSFSSRAWVNWLKDFYLVHHLVLLRVLYYTCLQCLHFFLRCESWLPKRKHRAKTKV